MKKKKLLKYLDSFIEDAAQDQAVWGELSSVEYTIQMETLRVIRLAVQEGAYKGV